MPPAPNPRPLSRILKSKVIFGSVVAASSWTQAMCLVRLLLTRGACLDLEVTETPTGWHYPKTRHLILVLVYMKYHEIPLCTFCSSYFQFLQVR